MTSLINLISALHKDYYITKYYKGDFWNSMQRLCVGDSPTLNIWNLWRMKEFFIRLFNLREGSSDMELLIKYGY